MTVQPENDRDFIFTEMARVPSAKGATFEEFRETISTWVARWCLVQRQRKKDTPAGYCAFVVDPAWIPPDKTTPKEHFKDDTPPKLQHCVRITDFALNRVHAVPAQCDDLDATIGAITALGLSAKPSVIFDPESQQVWFYPRGATDLVLRLKVDVANLSDPVPTGWADFEKLIEDIWISNLRYPVDHPALWHDPKKCYPCRMPETTVQGLLYIALRNRFLTLDGKPRGVLIEKEPHANVGRADLRAMSCAGDCYFAAEIKVTKSFSFASDDAKAPTKTTEASQLTWVKKGINQAAEYRDAHKGQVGILLVYDMRSTKSEYASVAAECQAKDIKCRQYPLYTKRDPNGADANTAIAIN